MKRFILTIILLPLLLILLLTTSLWAQGSSSSHPVRKVTSLPATCTAVGSSNSSDSVLYQGRLYLCTSTNTWTAVNAGATGITSLGGQTGATQTFANDTNVTISSSGDTHTLGWAGTLAAARLNSNVVQAITNDTNIQGSITAQNLTLAWAGTLAKARQHTATVYNDAANVWSTGLQDFNAATIKVPISIGYAPTVSGLFGYDSTANVFTGGANGTNRIFVTRDATEALANKTLGATTFTGKLSGSGAALELDDVNGVQASGGIRMGSAANNHTSLGWAAGLIGVRTTGKYGFTSSATDATGTQDTSWCRNAAGVHEFNRGACGSNLGLKVTATASGVNNLNIASAATTGHPTITAEGSDTNINVNLVPKGSGVGQVNGSTIVTSDNTITKTNLTLDAEGTGNVLTIPLKYWFPAAGCNNATAATMFDLPTTTPAVAACVTGTNTQKGVLDFADTTGGFSAQNHLLLPADFTGNIDARIIWLTTATTGNAKWSLSTVCTAVDATETDDPAFNTASTVTTAAPGIANRLQTSSITTVTATGCAAGGLLHFKIFRDGNDASDTIAATARLVGVELTIRGAK